MAQKNFSQEEVQNLFDMCDSNKDKRLDKAEFAQLMKKISTKEHSDAELQQIFDEVDANKNGTICLGELQAAFQK